MPEVLTENSPKRHQEEILSVENLALRYRLLVRRPSTLKARVFNTLRGHSNGEIHQYTALENVSFAMKRGEVLGICGRNGSGKSSLLRVLSGTSKPARGRITVRAHIGGILGLAGGFHPESTGRENIFLSGLLMGMDDRSIRRKLDSIIEFAELGEFIESPIRTYSSGMVARLGFAIAAHLDVELMLIDEVLSVGDAKFCVKCEQWIQNRLAAGVSVVLVSHDLTQLRRLCHRVMWLHQGSVRELGAPNFVLDRYVHWCNVGEEQYWADVRRIEAEEAARAAATQENS